MASTKKAIRPFEEDGMGLDVEGYQGSLRRGEEAEEERGGIRRLGKPLT